MHRKQTKIVKEKNRKKLLYNTRNEFVYVHVFGFFCWYMSRFSFGIYMPSLFIRQGWLVNKDRHF